MTENELRDRIRSLVKNGYQTILCKIVSVDKTERTCSVDYDGVIIYGVRLQSVTGGSTGITIYPQTGAQALCLQIEGSDEYTLLQVSEIESMEIQIGSRSLKTDKDGFVFNQGSVGITKTDKMVEWMSKVYSDMQTLITLLSTSAVAGNGAALGIVFTPQTPSPQLTDFEDTTIKH